MSEKSLSPHFDSVRFLADASQQPGIYQMFGVDGNILYVGKAKNLKNVDSLPGNQISINKSKPKTLNNVKYDQIQM